jgi:hypothetical protein
MMTGKEWVAAHFGQQKGKALRYLLAFHQYVSDSPEDAYTTASDFTRRDIVASLPDGHPLIDQAAIDADWFVQVAALVRLPPLHPVRMAAFDDSNDLIRRDLLDSATVTDAEREYLATGAKHASVRARALSVIDPAHSVREVAFKDADPLVRASAVRGAANQLLVYRGVMDVDPNVRKSAAESLPKDSPILSCLALRDPDSGVRQVAIRQSSDAAALEHLARNIAEPMTIRVGALRRLWPSHPLRAEILADLSQPIELQEAAIDRSSDPDVLAQIALDASRHPSLRRIAVRYLHYSHPAVKAALGDPDLEVREAAVNALVAHDVPWDIAYDIRRDPAWCRAYVSLGRCEDVRVAELDPPEEHSKPEEGNNVLGVDRSGHRGSGVRC